MITVYDNYNNKHIKFNDNTKYVYVVTSIKTTPEGFSYLSSDNKSEEFIELVKLGKNIIITSVMFYMLPKDSIKYLHDYELVIDCLILPFNVMYVDKQDIDMLCDSSYISLVNNDIIWDKYPYNGTFSYLCREATHKKVSLVNNKVQISQPHTYVFTSFRDSYIYTKMFNGQLLKYYFELNNIVYNVVSNDKIDLSGIHILNDYKLNIIGKQKTALSKNWLKTNDLEQLRKHTRNFIRNKMTKLSGDKYSSKSCVWTTYKEFYDKLRDKGYSKHYKNILNEEYTGSNGVAYIANIFINSFIKSYLDSNGVNTNNDEYALSMLLNFLYTCDINDLYVYLPSKRMRDLLTAYIEQNS